MRRARVRRALVERCRPAIATISPVAGRLSRRRSRSGAARLSPPDIGRGRAAPFVRSTAMTRRLLLLRLAALSALASLSGMPTSTKPAQGARLQTRVRPGSPGWPAEASWQRLSREVGGRLVQVQSQFAACVRDGAGEESGGLIASLEYSYSTRYEDGMTQWLDR